MMDLNVKRIQFVFYSIIGVVLAQDSYLDSHKPTYNHMSEADRVNEQKQEGEAFRRDGWGRNDPNQLLNGFFPAWAILLIGLAGKTLFQN
jgi:hypothetical protein